MPAPQFAQRKRIPASLKSLSRNLDCRDGRCTVAVQVLYTNQTAVFWGITAMSKRIEAAQNLYRTRFPDENLTPLRAFEDKNYVLVQFLHGKRDDKETPLGTEVFEFKGDVSIHSIRRRLGKL